MIPATPGVRVKPLPSLSAIRREWSEILDDAAWESKRDFPLSPREVHDRAASDLYKRLSYVLVEVPNV